MTKNKKTVCAVVVTYNRKKLLIECLEALRRQTRPVDAIYIIDNASTDGTPEVLLKEGYIKELPPENLSNPREKKFKVKNLTNRESIKVHYVRMHKNTGGAGGFHEGVKRAYEREYDWLWLMDDDTISDSNALFELLIANNKLNEKQIKSGFLCSKVLWIDNTPHLMNLPSITPLVNDTPFNLYEEEGLLIIESASFVSLLINKKIIKNVGLPIKEFFIWGDDVEFTKRITKNIFWGAYVNKSIVYHKTCINYSAMNVHDDRFYYYLRNRLYIHKKYERKKYFFLLIWNLIHTFVLPIRLWIPNIRACLSSLLFSPKIKLLK